MSALTPLTLPRRTRIQGFFVMGGQRAWKTHFTRWMGGGGKEKRDKLELQEQDDWKKGAAKIVT